MLGMPSKKEGILSSAKKILYVDDDVNLQTLMKGRLEACGFQVASVYDGDEAITTINQEKPDLIILDIMLPGAGGYELCMKIKQDKELASIPVLMFSARMGDIDRSLGMSCGANSYVPKCHGFNQILDEIDKLI
jgi:DNA-binding response OmpR family regulator